MQVPLEDFFNIVARDIISDAANMNKFSTNKPGSITTAYLRSLVNTSKSITHVLTRRKVNYVVFHVVQSMYNYTSLDIPQELVFVAPNGDKITVEQD